MWEENLKLYDELIDGCPDFERKGKTVPYTSANGHMFSQLNKDGQIGIRLPKAEGKIFMEKYNTGEFRSYGAVMREYILIPEELYTEKELLRKTLNLGFKHVMSLPPK